MEEDRIISSSAPKIGLVVALFFLPVLPLFASDEDVPTGDDSKEYFTQAQALGTNVKGLISKNTTWTVAGSPYIVTGGNVTVGKNAALTIEPGVVVKFNANLAILVGSATDGKGCLVARGRENSPITFTSNAGAIPGKWSRIHFTDYAVDAVYDTNGNYISGSMLEHVIVEYAGYSNYGAIFAEKSSPFLNYCEARHNSYYGIRVDGINGPAVKITNCQAWDNSKSGIYIWGGTGHKLLNNNIHDNHNTGIYFYSSNSNSLTTNTVCGNESESAGGGIVFYCSSGNTLIGNTISGNTSVGAGGGIYFYGHWNTLNQNTICDNKSDGVGGGITFYNSGGNTLTGNTISGNTSSNFGGGIYFGGDSPGSSGSNTLTANTILDNKSAGVAGAITFYNSVGNTLIANAIQNNTSGFGFVQSTSTQRQIPYFPGIP